MKKFYAFALSAMMILPPVLIHVKQNTIKINIHNLLKKK